MAMHEGALTASLMAEFSPPAARTWNSAYGWIPIAGGFVSFVLAVVAGANDVPSAFSMAVGSAVLTLRQSMLLALLMEFVGAVLLGGHKIVGLEECILKEKPGVDLLMWGFMVAMIAATLWLAVATFMEMPVTSLLSIEAAMMGVALASHGFNSIYWVKHDPGSVLQIGGVTSIVLSWVVAPLFALIAAIAIFGAIKFILLRSNAAEERTLKALPLLYGTTVLVLSFFIVYRGAPGTQLPNMNLGTAAIIASSSAVFAAILALLIIVPLARKGRVFFGCTESKRICGALDTAAPIPQDTMTEATSVSEQKELTPEALIKQFNELRVLHTVYEGDEEEADDQTPPAPTKCSPVCGPTTLPLKQFLAGTSNNLSFKRLRHRKKVTTRQKLTNLVWKFRKSTFDHEFEYDRKTLVHHALAEKFESKVEDLFSFLVILLACATALAHGSNDVASIMGPYAGILNLFARHNHQSTGYLMSKWELSTWVSALGGLGVSIGYAACGWKVMRCLGGRVTFLSPSRAFSAQICTVGTVVMASRFRFPVSTTHILIGAILGVSIADNVKNVNWQIVGAFLLMWVLTLIMTCGTTAALYAFTIFSPSVLVQA